MSGRNRKHFGVNGNDNQQVGKHPMADERHQADGSAIIDQQVLERQTGIRIVSRETLYKGFVQLEKVGVEQTTADGRLLKFDREIHDHGVAAAILLYDPNRDSVIMVRQLRLPVYFHDGNGLMIEVPAGLLDGGEAADRAIAREAMEETGYKVGNVRFLFDVFMSPGALTERVSFFVGLIDAGDRAGLGGGLADEHEEIEVLEIGFADACAMIASGQICDAKTIMLLQWAMLNKATLKGNVNGVDILVEQNFPELPHPQLLPPR
jgi:nudix-type nucleoside diphosphatase (YffH/AdpP family)